MVKCSNCGFDAGEGKFCPNCGHEVKSTDDVNICSNCGADVGESNFCPNCGHPSQKTQKPTFCPGCGEEIDPNTKFCPHCGFSKSNNEANAEKSLVDDAIELDEKISGKLGGLFGKSKAMNTLLDKTASMGYNRAMNNSFSDMDRKYYAKIEPVFLEVFDSIDDKLIKALLIHKRSMMSSGGSVIGVVASQIYTPTKDMPHDEAVRYYQNLVNEIVAEINVEKQNGTFDEEEFYKKKVKDNTFDNVSVFGFSKSITAYRNNKK